MITYGEDELMVHMCVWHDQIGPGIVTKIVKDTIDVNFWFAAPIATVYHKSLKLIILTDEIKTKINEILISAKKVELKGEENGN